jgi:hypothetical protein
MPLFRGDQKIVMVILAKEDSWIDEAVRIVAFLKVEEASKKLDPECRILLSLSL